MSGLWRDEYNTRQAWNKQYLPLPVLNNIPAGDNSAASGGPMDAGSRLQLQWQEYFYIQPDNYFSVIY